MKYSVKISPFRSATTGAVLLTLAACAGETNKAGDASSDAAVSSPDAPQVDTKAPPKTDTAAPMYSCPSDMPGGPDGGLLPARHAAGSVPALAEAIEPSPLPTMDVVFSVDPRQGMWPISPDIYGVNTPTSTTGTDATVRATSQRLGGNRLSAFNWENNASNAGNDYKYQNDGYLGASDAPGDAVRSAINDAWAHGAQAVLTVPIGDYVSADKAPPGDVRTDAGTEYLSTRFKKNVAAKNAPFSNPPNQADDSVFQDEFVAWAAACAGTVPLAFCLDNEPDLWSSTHAEIHPLPVTYAELSERTIRFATAIKAAWPAAPILGFVSYGWNGFNNLQNAPDASVNGNFVDYFLSQMKAAEDSAGKRLVDYLDLHWYPEAKGGNARIVFDTAPTGANLTAYQEARMQAPRSLWDSTYKETSWITDNTKTPINLIPRMKQRIAAKYPGTKLAFTEWNYGGANDITGAIATADVLGIFGREKVDMAHIWPLSSKEPFVAAGLKAFRNYDGQSGEFGDIAIAATNSDTVNTSVYASLPSGNPNQVIVVAINKKSDVVTAGIRIAHPSELASSKVFVLQGTTPSLTAAPALSAAGSNAFTYAMPPRSVTVLVFAGGPAPQPALDGGVPVDADPAGPVDGALTIDSSSGG
jgi:hypothetical protein